MKQEFKMNPIGFIRKNETKTWIEITEKFQPGLLNLDKFSHLITIWWIEGRDTKEDRARLQVHPCVDGKREKSPLTGVFACRAPLRPNPIGLTIVKIIKVVDNKIYIDRSDAFNDTPIIDLKPYIPKSDCILNATLPDFMDAIAHPKKAE